MTPKEDQALERRIFRRLGVRLFPLLVLILFVNFMDRANLGVVATPMSDDLGLSGSAFGLAAGLFYLGYLLFEVPSNVALHRFGARVWIARIMITWGIVTVALMFVTGPVSLNVLRFLLGAAEAGLFPGVILYLTFWCPGRLFARAYSTFQLAVPVGLALTSLITSAVLLMHGALGMAGWRWVFLIEGLPAIVLGVIVFFVLPNGPKNAKWLNPDERSYLLEHAQASEPGGAHRRGALAEVMRTPRVWIYAVLYFCMIVGFWTITYWLPTVVKEHFDVGTVGAGLISAIPWAFTAVVMFLVGISSTRTGDVRWHMIVCLVVGGLTLLASTLVGSPILALICLCFAAGGIQAASPLFWARTSTVFAGALCTVAIAFINSLGNISGLVGPYVLGLLTDLTGDTRLGLVVMSGFIMVAALLTFLVTRTPAPAGRGR
ncbi:MFS transporter [Actinomadura madurae]|uniref:MFS transporter n=1 Tax=Actinomadura madurae TaxID=1993 RepID=UPI0020D1F7E2|nr:MFS transporter [Actinomadura madurae]MCP9953868.1 MFS transporter [Actinomadura madurae]MCQ0005353.1 MFS transporter [Actinomadura madurae]